MREYPSFAESASSLHGSSEIWKTDRGSTLRAFLPVRDPEERRLLDSFDGYSRVWDLRFSCMPVNFKGFITKGTEPLWDSVYVGGNLSVTLPSHMHVKKSESSGEAESQVLKIFHVNCSLAFPAAKNPEREWAVTICSVFDPTTQTRLSMDTPLVSPDEPEINATPQAGLSLGPRSPQQYLVINTTGSSLDWYFGLKDDNDWHFAIEEPFGTFSAPVTYSSSYFNTTTDATLVVAMSYCAASFQSAVVPVSMKRRRNNSNAGPVAELNNDNRYKNSSSLQEIARLYAGAMSGDSLSARGVLELEPRVAAAGHGWSAGWAFSDTMRAYELAIVKLENIHEGALQQGTGVGASVGLCSRCELDSHSSFRAHKDHAAVFQHILHSTAGSLPLAMQTVWTILAQMAYYEHLPECNVKREASIASFRQVLVPVGVNGLVFVGAIIIIQNVAVALIVVLFLRRTRLSLVGNLWQGFGQLVASDVSRMALRTTVASDKEVLSQLGKEGVRTSSVSLAYDFQGKVSRLESRINIK